MKKAPTVITMADSRTYREKQDDLSPESEGQLEEPREREHLKTKEEKLPEQGSSRNL